MKELVTGAGDVLISLLLLLLNTSRYWKDEDASQR